jgi:integrase
MAKIRSHNEGSIHQRPDGKWRAQVSIDGHRLSFTAKTKKEALDWIHETKNQIKSGLTFEATDTTLEEFLREWLITVASSKSKGTHATYQWTVDKRIVPKLGKIKLIELTPERIQRFYNQAQIIGVGENQQKDLSRNEEKALSAHAIRVIHKTLRSAMTHAVDLGVLSRNPCRGVKPPKHKTVEMKFYDEQQVRCLLKTARETGNKLYALYYLAIHTGMREAELLGLQWKDIDWKLSTLHVERQVRHFKGSSHEFLKPKSKSAIRPIALGKKALDVLLQHKEEQEAVRNAAGADWTDLDLVFACSVGTPYTASNLRRDFRKLLSASGLPRIRFHDLRHTAATLMLNHGVPIFVVSQRLGHATISITVDIYGHRMLSAQEKAADYMDGLVEDE